MKHLPTFLLATATLLLAGCAKNENNEATVLRPAPMSAVTLSGELAQRLDRNFDRLESDMYQPDSIFHSRLADSWPGDAQGRIVLGLVCDAQASHRQPLYLDTILAHYPTFMNEEGYFGPRFEGKLNEQQLSGNGWVLRGLCQYYEWTNDEKVLPMIQNIVDNLFMKGKERFANYPIDPDERKKNLGDAIGEIVYDDQAWVLSSDIGCLFIGMEGLIHAYTLIGGDELRSLIETLIDRFLEIDLTSIRAQTHASLTACRGLIRFAEATGQVERFLPLVQERWQTYVDYGMTAGYQNYNWFCRPETWSEPCAVVDSYMLAVQLWMHTHEPSYLDQAELIYYNGLCHDQRANGGFGCDFCPSELTGRKDIAVRTDEASWCCTMRGAEGLQCAAQYRYFTKGDELYIPFYGASQLSLEQGASLVQTTPYPEVGMVELTLTHVANLKALHLRVPVGATAPKLEVNGQHYEAVTDECNFLQLTDLKDGDVVRLTFDMPKREEHVGEYIKTLRGPLLLSEPDHQPIYHLLDETVNKADGYSRVIMK